MDPPTPAHSHTLTHTYSLKPTVVYDPAKSETYKFLQEQELGDHVQEVTVPPQPKVFSPNKVPVAMRVSLL